jgi:hypothetical protein
MRIKYSMPVLVYLLSSVSAGGATPTGGQQGMGVEKSAMSAVAQRQATEAPQGGSTDPFPPSDVMIVDPKEVAKDWTLAYTMLKNKQTGNIVFTLRGGETIESIVEIQSLPGGYLMFLTLKTLHGMQYRIIKTSEISSLSS